MEVTLILNSRDFSDRLSTYKVKKELIAPKVITTLDYVEHVPIKRYRDVISFTLIPMSDDVANEDYDTLSAGVLTAIFTDPYSGSDRIQTVHIVTNLDAVYGIKSVDGNRYYKGSEIVLRATSPGQGEAAE